MDTVRSRRVRLSVDGFPVGPGASGGSVSRTQCRTHLTGHTSVGSTLLIALPGLLERCGYRFPFPVPTKGESGRRKGSPSSLPLSPWSSQDSLPGRTRRGSETRESSEDKSGVFPLTGTDPVGGRGSRGWRQTTFTVPLGLPRLPVVTSGPVRGPAASSGNVPVSLYPSTTVPGTGTTGPVPGTRGHDTVAIWWGGRRTLDLCQTRGVPGFTLSTPPPLPHPT